MNTVVLVIDENEVDRQTVLEVAENAATKVFGLGTPEEAVQLANDLPNISAIVAAIPDVNGESIFQFREHLVKKYNTKVPAVFCSRNDMSAYYSKLVDGDKLFYKPIEIPVLKDWLSETVGPLPVVTESVEVGPIESYDEALPVGTQLGDYKLEREIQHDKDFALYEAEQTSIDRKVAIKLLYRKHRRDAAWVHAFVNEASARARVDHPNVSLVYECIQESGVNFYTLELVDAPSLESLANENAPITDNLIYDILDSCCGALEYFRKNKMEHRLIGAQMILLQNGEQVRIANPVKNLGTTISPEGESQQMQLLYDALLPLSQSNNVHDNTRRLISRLGADQIDSINSIDQLRKALSVSRVQSSPQIQSGDFTTAQASSTYAEVSAKMQEEKADKKAIVIGTLVGLLLVLGLIFGGMKLLQKPPEVREFNEFVKIEAGEFIYQKEEKAALPEFWIAKHEVTINQYAEFLEWANAEPDALAKIQHPDQPDSKDTHEPLAWVSMYNAAVKGGKFKGAKIDLNYPIHSVDWWDAFAYARYKNARLPTEREWEKAARGERGSTYPWGSRLDTSAFNSGLDQEDKVDQKAGSVDNYRFWSPVDGIISDVSSFNVVGMAGNVSEWTNSWSKGDGEKRVPIKRGASFGTRKDFELAVRRQAKPGDRVVYTGIRIVSDVEPGTVEGYQQMEPKSTPKSEEEPNDSLETEILEPVAPLFTWDPADGDDPFKSPFAVPANK